MKLTGIKIGGHYLHPLSVKQGADDQLKSDQKQVDEQFNPDWLKTKEHYEEIIRGIVKEHGELVGEIFREIESSFAHKDYTGRKRSGSFVLECKPWQALKQKYLK